MDPDFASPPPSWRPETLNLTMSGECFTNKHYLCTEGVELDSDEMYDKLVCECRCHESELRMVLHKLVGDHTWVEDRGWVRTPDGRTVPRFPRCSVCGVAEDA